VLAAATPAIALRWPSKPVRLATKYMTPVMVPSDSSSATGPSRGRIVDPDELPDLHHTGDSLAGAIRPYRDPKTLAPPWDLARNAPFMSIRIGGLERPTSPAL